MPKEYLSNQHRNTKLLCNTKLLKINRFLQGFTSSRRLLLADRFRLSAPCSLLMSQLRTDSEMTALAETPEFMVSFDLIQNYDDF